MEQSVFMPRGNHADSLYLNQDAATPPADDSVSFPLSQTSLGKGLTGSTIKTNTFNTDFTTTNASNTDNMSNTTNGGGLGCQGTCCVANPADAIFAKVACQWDALKLSVNTMLESDALSQDPCATKKTTTTPAGKTAAGAAGSPLNAAGQPAAPAKSSSTGLIIGVSAGFVLLTVVAVLALRKVKKGK